MTNNRSHAVKVRDQDVAVNPCASLVSTYHLNFFEQVKSKYVIEDLPAAIPSIQPSFDKPLPNPGVGEQVN